MTFPVQKTEAEWREVLAAKGAEPRAFDVTRHAPHRNALSAASSKQVWADGSYHCICCGNKLFDADTKFDAGCGWPSFSLAVAGRPSPRSPTVPTAWCAWKTVCSQCGAHLGHVFEDGPTDTGLRYCMNSASLETPAQKGHPMKAQSVPRHHRRHAAHPPAAPVRQGEPAGLDQV
jgi:peptide-methionine (R)-S-oxide reductase